MTLFYYARVALLFDDRAMGARDGVCKSREVLCERHFQFFFPLFFLRGWISENAVMSERRN